MSRAWLMISTLLIVVWLYGCACGGSKMVSEQTPYAKEVASTIAPTGKVVAWGFAAFPGDETAEWVLWESEDVVAHFFSKPLNNPELLYRVGDTGWSPYLIHRGTITSFQMTSIHYAAVYDCRFSERLPVIDTAAVYQQCGKFRKAAGIKIEVTGFSTNY